MKTQFFLLFWICSTVVGLRISLKPFSAVISTRTRLFDATDRGCPFPNTPNLNPIEVSMLESHYSMPSITKGDVVTGTIIDVGKSFAHLDVQDSCTVVLPIAEVATVPPTDLREIYSVGTTVSGMIVGTLRGIPVISPKYLDNCRIWNKLKKMKSLGEVVNVTVVAVNSGGALVKYDGLNGFLPNSHLISSPSTDILRTVIQVKMLEVDPEGKKLIVSQRTAPQLSSSSSTLCLLKPGAVVTACVTGVAKYGVFVMIEGHGKALLHLSQISGIPLSNFTQLHALFPLNSKITAVVAAFDNSTGKVALSTKSLELWPGEILSNKEEVFQRSCLQLTSTTPTLPPSSSVHLEAEEISRSRDAVHSKYSWKPPETVSGGVTKTGADDPAHLSSKSTYTLNEFLLK